MNKLFAFIIPLVLVAGSLYALFVKQNVSVETMPPVVVKTLPVSGDTEVDPSLSEIKVTFSKDMLTENMWSWVKLDDQTFPEINGKVKYLDDKRTCVLPVRLEPGKAYVIWINSQKFNAFRDRDNRPAVPYLLVFETKSVKVKSD